MPGECPRDDTAECRHGTLERSDGCDQVGRIRTEERQLDVQQKGEPMGRVRERRVAFCVSGRRWSVAAGGFEVSRRGDEPVTWLRSLDSAQAARVGRRLSKTRWFAPRSSSSSSSSAPSSSRGTIDQALSAETIVSNSSRATVSRGQY